MIQKTKHSDKYMTTYILYDLYHITRALKIDKNLKFRYSMLVSKVEYII